MRKDVKLALTAAALAGTAAAGVIAGSEISNQKTNSLESTLNALTGKNTLVLPTNTATSNDNLADSLKNSSLLPSLTPMPTQNVSNETQNDNWDAQDTLHKITTKTEFVTWFNSEAAKNLQPGEDRSFDRIAKLAESSTIAIFTRDNDKLPLAKELRANAKGIGQQVLLQLGYKNISDDDSQNLGLKIFNKTFSISADGKTIWTRVSYPADQEGIVREKQPERHVCAVYQPGVKVSQEYFDAASTMHLSNEVPVAFVSRTGGSKIEDPDILHMDLRDANGETETVYWVFQDNGSQPNKKYAGLDAPNGLTLDNKFDQDAWGADMLQPCGTGSVKAGPTPTPAPTQPLPYNTPNQPKTPEQPKTPVPTTPFAPSPMPTNADKFTQVPSPIATTPKDVIPPTNVG